ncbi:hypothetical protein GTQ43_39055 [Nostoc sp. KVJ3]|uniref:GldG family protein n=1 Tax=Nostoc sp. KVJ3 TaxID=457945 RepID=UPI0022390DD7|nr:GldG family protein [Nostoc sp. KVJ3]MCW5319356.1 hypothetical protein [Nostoc sp. KVJ3]
MINILFDESHAELLLKSVPDNENKVKRYSYKELLTNLKNLGFNVNIYPARGKFFKKALPYYDVLVLAAPTQGFTEEELDAINDFVSQGKSLLIAHSHESLKIQNRQNSKSINRLLEPFGLIIKEMLNHPQKTVFNFESHYISTGISNLEINRPAYIKILNESPYIIAKLPDTYQPFLASVEYNYTRIVVIGDCVFFSDNDINKSDNRQLMLNIFNWLTRNNLIDCYEAKVPSRVLYKQKTQFSLKLRNSHRTRLDYIECYLESDNGALIDESVKNIRSIPPNEDFFLQWDICPQRLGYHKLNLTIDFLQYQNKKTIFFDSVSSFNCLPDAEIDLVIFNQNRELSETFEVETGASFEVQALIRRAIIAKDSQKLPLQLALNPPLPHVKVENEDTNEKYNWQLQALDEGDWQIEVALAETGQSISRLIHIRPSIQESINKITRTIVTPLMREIHEKLAHIRQEFDAETIQNISFRLLTAEQYIQILYPPENADDPLEVVQASRQEIHRYEPLIKKLLNWVFPTYSPQLGCCIPYDEKLAEHLTRKHPDYEDNFANNFLYTPECNEQDKNLKKQYIAALIIHEKYGHGFFFNQTQLGKQIAILYRHGLLRSIDTVYLKYPYPRLIYEKYQVAIEAINDSAIRVNEGFSAWIELALLPQLSGSTGHIVYQRKDFLFNRDDFLEVLSNSGKSEYFKKFKPFRPSTYEEGYDYFNLIQGYFGKSCGSKCAVQAMLKATDINLGIIENDNQVKIGLEAKELEYALLESEKDDARADRRLRRIHAVLRKHREKIRTEQKRLQCHRNCLHPECPVNAVIYKELGW